MKKITIALALCLAAFMASLAFVSCGNNENTQETQKKDNEPMVENKNNEEKNQNPELFEFTPENYPNMGGSLANLPLGQAITANVLGIDRDKTGEYILFEGSTTDNYKALIDGTFDILLAYEPSEEAKEYAKTNNAEYEMTAIGADALVFICSTENPVSGLTTDEVKDIYRGNIKNWNEVGGADLNIIPYQRNKDSGSQTLFDKLVNLGNELMDAPTEQRIGSMIGLLEAVADYEDSDGALGYTVYYYLTNMEKDKLDSSKILDVDGVTPTNDSISAGEYPFVNDFYVVIRKDAPENSPERILYNWVCSEQGKQLVESENYPTK